MQFKSGNKVKQAHNEQGFTLIEVLIALAIFSIGILAVGSMQLRSTGGSTNARILTEASIWGQDRVETLMSCAYTDPVITPADGTERSAIAGSYIVRWRAWDEFNATPWAVTAAPGTKIIRVTVTGRDNLAATTTGRGSRSATVTFVRARDV